MKTEFVYTIGKNKIASCSCGRLSAHICEAGFREYAVCALVADQTTKETHVEHVYTTRDTRKATRLVQEWVVNCKYCKPKTRK